MPRRRQSNTTPSAPLDRPRTTAAERATARLDLEGGRSTARPRRGRQPTAPTCTRSEYRGDVGTEIARLTRRLPKREQEAAGRFLYRWQQCQRYVVVDRCGSCGRDQPGTGRTHYAGAIFCAGRTCDACSRRRADARAKFFDRVFDTVSVIAEYQWAFLTITFPRSAGERRHADLPAVKAKVRSLIEFSQKLWRKRLKAPNAGLFRTIEVSQRGMLHIHGVYYGPVLTSTVLAEWCKEIDETSGFVDVQTLTAREVADTKVAVVRAARYSAKGGNKPPKRSKLRLQLDQGVADESERYLADESLRPAPIHPIVAARFELATRYVHLAEPYGVLRGLGAVEDDDGAPDDGNEQLPEGAIAAPGGSGGAEYPGDAPEALAPPRCVHCGAAGLQRGLRRIVSYLRECHSIGSHGLARTRAPCAASSHVADGTWAQPR